MQIESYGSTSTSLIERVKVKNEDAWTRLVHLYGKLVYFWCHESGLSESERADVFQEVFRSVDQSIGTLRLDRPGDSFRGWLRTVTRNKIIDAHRRNSREPSASGGTDSYLRMMQTPEFDLDDSVDAVESERGILIKQAMALIQSEFEPRTWEAFWRATADGIPTHIISEQLGMSSVAIRKAKSRVLKRIREEFSGLEDFDFSSGPGQQIDAKQDCQQSAQQKQASNRQEEGAG